MESVLTARSLCVFGSSLLTASLSSRQMQWQQLSQLTARCLSQTWQSSCQVSGNPKAHFRVTDVMALEFMAVVWDRLVVISSLAPLWLWLLLWLRSLLWLLLRRLPLIRILLLASAAIAVLSRCSFCCYSYNVFYRYCYGYCCCYGYGTATCYYCCCHRYPSIATTSGRYCCC